MYPSEDTSSSRRQVIGVMRVGSALIAGGGKEEGGREAGAAPEEEGSQEREEGRSAGEREGIKRK